MGLRNIWHWIGRGGGEESMLVTQFDFTIVLLRSYFTPCAYVSPKPFLCILLQRFSQTFPFVFFTFGFLYLPFFYELSQFFFNIPIFQFVHYTSFDFFFLLSTLVLFPHFHIIIFLSLLYLTYYFTFIISFATESISYDNSCKLIPNDNGVTLYCCWCCRIILRPLI